MHNFQALEIALSMIGSLRAPLAKIARHDRDLARQVRKAAASVALNLGEGRRRSGGDRLHLWRVAGGSADETRIALLIAVAWAYIDQDEVAEALGLLDSLLAITWKLTH